MEDSLSPYLQTSSNTIILLKLRVNDIGNKITYTYEHSVLDASLGPEFYWDASNYLRINASTSGVLSEIHTTSSIIGDGTSENPISLVNDLDVVSPECYYGTSIDGLKGYWPMSDLLRGPQGYQGAQGSQGVQGPQGSDGTQGPMGYQGYQGSSGGPQGYQGPQGPQGYQGATGQVGPQGYQGSIGPQGYQGTQGYTGVTGPQGYQGATGSQGPQGYQGPQGHNGIDGTQGPQGAQGKSSPQIYSGTQSSHNFSIGNCVKPYASGWVKTKADSRSNAGTVGIVSSIVDQDNFEYITGGLLPSAGTYTDGSSYFLSTSTFGATMTLPDVESWTVGEVREFIGTGTPEGLMVEIDVGDEIMAISYSSHNPVTIANDSSLVASIDSNQVLTINASIGGSTYVLPIASDTSLGGIKVGSGLSITGSGELSTLGSSKNYSALVTQSSTNNPTVIVLENTIGTITPVRTDVGTYRFTSSGLFTVDKTAPIDDVMMDQVGNLYKLNLIDSSNMELKTCASSNISVTADNILNKRYINITVFS